LEALGLTDEGEPERPSLQLLVGYAQQLVGFQDTAELVEPAIEGFLAQGEPGRAAEAAVLLGTAYFYLGDMERVRIFRTRSLELAREAPPSVATARALASVARSLHVIDRDSAGATALAREALVLAEETGDDETAAVCLHTIGMARVYSGDPGGIDDLDRSVERAERSGSVFHHHSALNNLANTLWHIGRLADGSARILEARALCERHGFASALLWNDAELVYDAFYRGDLKAVVEDATRFLASHDPTEISYQDRPILATRARALLARGQAEDAAADAELALVGWREAGADAQVAAYILTSASFAHRALGRDAEADALLTEALAGDLDEDMFDLTLHLVELGRGQEYIAAMGPETGYAWLSAARLAAAGDLAGASAVYAEIGARFPEAWAALLAAEHGDTSRLDAALAYFEEQGATPYVQRCRALLQASA
jgi:tetratricopeptide (TPR) repeat protein